MAGGITLGFLKYVLGFDSITFRKGMTDAERDLVALQKSFEKKGKAIQAFGKSLTAFVTLPIAGIAAAGIKEAQETQQAMAQVNAALASTGGTAGRTAEQLKAAADAFELKSLHESDEILKDVTARLLTFGNVSGAIFDRAQQAILNYSQRSGKDLGAATTLIGKALNDPAKAMGVLSKAGVTLTDSQQKLLAQFIATGNVAGAQGVILDGVARGYRGAAEAAANTDPLNRANKAWKQMAEQIGTALLPLLDNFASAVVGIAGAFNSLPQGVQTSIVAFAGVAAALGPVLVGVGGLIKLLAGVKTVVLFSQGLLGLAAAEGTAATGATAAGIAFRAMLGPIGLIITAATAAYLAWKNWDKIKPIVQDMVKGVANALRGLISGPLENAKKRIAEVTDAFRTMWDKVVGHSYVPDTVDAIQHHFGRLGAVMVAPAEKAAKATAAAFKKLKDDVSQLMDQLFPEDAQFRQDITNLALLDKAAKAGIISADRLSEARRRLLQIPSEAEVSSDLLSPQPLDHIAGGLDEIAGKIPEIVDVSNRWGEAVANVGRELSDIVANDLSNLIEGTGKLRDLWKDLLALGIRQLTSSNGLFGTFLSGHRATGGPVLAGGSYLIGERGPEIFQPSTSGRILSNADSRAAIGRGTNSVVVHQHISTPNADSFHRSSGQIIRTLKRRLR